MKLKDYVVDDVVVLEVSGKVFSPNDAILFKGKVLEYMQEGKRHFVADLDKLTSSNSQGLRMLIGSYLSVTPAGGRFVLANITNIKQLMVMTRLERVFETYDSLEEALKSLEVAEEIQQ